MSEREAAILKALVGGVEFHEFHGSDSFTKRTLCSLFDKLEDNISLSHDNYTFSDLFETEGDGIAIK